MSKQTTGYPTRLKGQPVVPGDRLICLTGDYRTGSRHRSLWLVEAENIERIKARLQDVESPGGFTEWRRATDEEWATVLAEQADEERQRRIKRLQHMDWGNLSDEAVQRILEIAAAG